MCNETPEIAIGRMEQDHGGVARGRNTHMRKVRHFLLSLASDSPTGQASDVRNSDQSRDKV